MIFSEALLHGCNASNGVNNYGISQKTMNNVESGLVNMNYQSTLIIRNCTIDSFVGAQTGLVFLTGQSSLKIYDGTTVANIGGSYGIEGKSSGSIEISDLRMTASNAIAIWAMQEGEEFVVKDSYFEAPKVDWDY